MHTYFCRGNAFRLAVLWRFGGTYFDLDIISVNSLTQTTPDGKTIPLRRFIAREEPQQLNNAALRFPKDDPMLWEIMVNFVKKVATISLMDSLMDMSGREMVRFA